MKFKNVLPGMVIKSERLRGLIISISGNHSTGKRRHYNRKEPGHWVYYFDSEEGYYGGGHTQFDPEEKVTVLKGKKREAYINSIRRDLRKRISDADRDLDIIDLIESMHKE